VDHTADLIQVNAARAGMATPSSRNPDAGDGLTPATFKMTDRLAHGAEP
jgi:hypothetical protein